MANVPGTKIDSITHELYLIEGSVLASDNQSWHPVSIQATPQTKRLINDPNRVLAAGLVNLSGVIAYRIEEYAMTALGIVAAASQGVQYRLVKMVTTIDRFFAAGVTRE